ncbi:uncharacterized protein LOC134283560 [Saccostrea cucullata]|uniref:uncharacterized protein LOC134283560 n=1 Tax=Saccostrea cuccullata TaxID=36930 RepID=UPI002ED67E0E
MKIMDESDRNNFHDYSTTECVAHLIEKSTEKSSNFLNNIWTKGTSAEIDEIKVESEDEVLSNNLKETEFFESDPLQPQDDNVPELGAAQCSFDPNQMYFVKEGKSDRLHDSSKECEDFSDDDGDATDYFDSDDEYQVSCNRRLMREADDDFIHGGFDRYSTTQTDGRYSKGVEQFVNMPVYLRSIRKFATDNNFELWNGKTDGSCMFRSIADQLMINGHFGHTTDTLRHLAIEYLRDHPLQEDGCPITSFLSSESWEEYLTRMSNPIEWSDHIMLKAIVDALHLESVVFNIYKDDVRRTEVKSSRKDVPYPALIIYLGHLGEFHYVSLRPKKWEKLWTYRALLHRTLFCESKYPSHRISKHSLERYKDAGIKGNIHDIGFQKLVTSLSQKAKGEDQGGVKREESERLIPQESCYISTFNSYGLDELQNDNTNDLLDCLIEDPLHVDALTGIPLPHLSFILKLTFPKERIKNYSYIGGCMELENQWFLCIGTFATGDNVALKDLTQERKIFKNQCRFMKRDPSVVAVNSDNYIQFESAGLSLRNKKSIVHADCSATHPGYCWLRPLESQTSFVTKSVPGFNDGVFLTKQELPKEITLPPFTRQCCVGLVCKEFPAVAKEWVQRNRKFDWPPSYIISRIVSGGTCTLIQKGHPLSVHPDIEWKLDFSMAYSFLFLEALDNFQIHGYHVVKIMVEEATRILTKGLKRKHILSVFLYACEEIPQQKWKTNLTGCVLRTLSLMIIYLKRRYIPHYFISSNNIIDDFTEDEIDTICVFVEAMRLFPAMFVSLVARRHGYTFTENLRLGVLNDCKGFSKSRNLNGLYRKKFAPMTLRVSKFFCRLGFYKSAFELIRKMFEEMLEIHLPNEEKTLKRPTFSDFFLKGIREFKQKTTRGILGQLFDKNNKSDIFTRCSNESFKIVQDVVPWKVDFTLAWMRIPTEKSRNFALLASFFYDLSYSQYQMENVNISTVAIDIAILCIKRAISEELFNTEEVEDKELQKEIMIEQKDFKRNLKNRLFYYYIHAYKISLLDGCTHPIAIYMTAIEEISDEFPEHFEVVASMFCWTRNDKKGREYQRKFDDYISRQMMGGAKLTST